MTGTVIVAARRTAVGSFLGAFAKVPAHELGCAAIVAAMERSVAMALRWDWSLGQLRAPQWAPQWEQR